MQGLLSNEIQLCMQAYMQGNSEARGVLVNNWAFIPTTNKALSLPCGCPCRLAHRQKADHTSTYLCKQAAAT
jgi:hypothetical protein